MGILQAALVWGPPKRSISARLLRVVLFGPLLILWTIVVIVGVFPAVFAVARFIGPDNALEDSLFVAYGLVRIAVDRIWNGPLQEARPMS